MAGISLDLAWIAITLSGSTIKERWNIMSQVIIMILVSQFISTIQWYDSL